MRLRLSSGLVRVVGVVALGMIVAPEISAAPAPPAAPGTPPKNMRAALSDVALEPDGDGRLRHRGDGFTAIIHPDGTFEFRDHGGTAELNLFGLDMFRRRFREPEPERHPPIWIGVREELFFPQGRLPVAAGFIAHFGGLADGPRKDRHKSAKRHFLAATERLRAHLANRAYRERLQRELAELGLHLVEIWHDETLALAERKRQIFERWADCEDPSTPARSERDVLRHAFANAARAKIEAFVRQIAPQGSQQAYTRAELARLNRGRTGESRFRPYDVSRPPQVLANFEAVPDVDAPLLPPQSSATPPAAPVLPEPPPRTNVPPASPRISPPPDIGRPITAPERNVPGRKGMTLPLCLFTRNC
ncbi:hypothetical protein [Nannocystis pusilla]|uniref:Uncharacterized protein n=1 Tax=Nannocystis pusilla TaxID=889268 RepID=A0ABS7TKH2_9BACT|nr:hypothetical protein [Nannocystis pusilla]MBZ5708728.1 hypothetical protein [Nannocystis pusilla]